MDYVETLHKLIKEACKPYEGMPLAMSGGLDSSVLAYYIKPRFGVIVTSPYGDAYNELKYAEKVAKHLKIELKELKTEPIGFERDIDKAIKIIGKPTPHFNIYPLYVLYETLDKWGEKDIVIADGPDESMSGYTRNLIMNYLYEVYKFEAFEPYAGMITKLLKEIDPVKAYSKLTGSESRVHGSFKNLIEYMNRVDMEIKRPEMDIMGNKFAEHFGIKIHKPYESKEVDEFMFNLPVDWKIRDVEYGKYALRKLGERFLPTEIAWRKVKRGGPIFPVNKVMGWDSEGEFGKGKWFEYQKEVLK